MDEEDDEEASKEQWIGDGCTGIDDSEADSSQVPSRDELPNGDAHRE